MKKVFFTLMLIAAISAPSCKKETFCWSCIDNNGNDYNGELCGKTEKDIDDIRDQGYTCNKQ